MFLSKKVKINSNNRENFLKRYVTPGDPIAFAGRNKVAKILNTTNDDANKELLAYNYSYGLHRFQHKPKVRNPYFVYKPRDQAQCDLIDIRALKQYNNGMSFLLVLIDSFSKRAWVQPLKAKTSQETKQGFQKIFEEMDPLLPKSIGFDRGKEFVNQEVNNYLISKGIKTIHPNSYIKCGIAERFNQTIQILIYKYMTENATPVYIDVLQKLLETYNNRPHTGILDYTPIEAEKTENYRILAAKLRMKKMQPIILAGAKKDKKQFKVGDIVKVSKIKRPFDRGYKERFSREYFKIDSINDRQPIRMYILKSLNTDEIIEGGFYAEEIQLIKGDKYRIEKIIKTRKRGNQKEVLVKWLDFDEKHNSWEPASEVKRVFKNFPNIKQQ